MQQQENWEEMLPNNIMGLQKMSTNTLNGKETMKREFDLGSDKKRFSFLHDEPDLAGASIYKIVRKEQHWTFYHSGGFHSLLSWSHFL